jgi:hypothetical protein
VAYYFQGRSEAGAGGRAWVQQEQQQEQLENTIPKWGKALGMGSFMSTNFNFLISIVPVLRIWIHLIHMFFGLPDPDVRIRILLWIRIRLWIRILLSSYKNSEKNLGFY